MKSSQISFWSSRVPYLALLLLSVSLSACGIFGTGENTELEIRWLFSDGTNSNSRSLPAGSVGASYDIRFFPADVVPTPPNCIDPATQVKWEVFLKDSRIPDGLKIVAAHELQFSGTPTEPGGNFSLKITYSIECDQGASGSSGTFTLRIEGLTVTTSTLPAGIVNQAYSRPQLQATGGTGTLAWSLATGSGPLPSGLTLDSAGVISGTPTVAGTSSFTVQAQDSSPSPLTGTKLLSITVNPALAIQTASLPAGNVNQPYATTLLATGGTGTLIWSLAAGSGALPSGLTLSPAGVISGTPTVAETANFTVQVTDSANSATATKSFSIIIGAGRLFITSFGLPNGTEDGTYTATVQTTGGLAPLLFSIASGVLPGNVALTRATGVLSGLHPAGGTHNFTIRVQDSGNPQQTASQAYTVLILEVTTSTPLPDGILGQPYSQTFAAIGQKSPVTWSLAPGSTLPNGFTLTADTLSGPPTAAGTSNFTVQVTDSDTPPRTDQKDYALTVNNPAPVITTLAPSSVASGHAAFTLTVNGTGFISGSKVLWNGAARPTTFVSSTQLTAAIPAADIAVVGTASVTVFNPPPVGGLSNAATFTIDISLPPGSSAGVTDLVSQSSGLPGVPSNAGSAISGGGPLIAISQNGNRVVFQSEGTNLDGAEPGVFLRDIALGITNRVSKTLLNAPAAGSAVGESVSISADGFVVAFDSRANNHVAGVDTGDDRDVFVVNACISPGGPILCNPPDWVSVMPDGTEPLFGSSGQPSLSSTGRFVAFSSSAPLTGINTRRGQVFLRDRNTNVTTMISVNDLGDAGAGDSGGAAISANARFVAFVSGAPNLVAGDTNNRPDVFVHDTCFAASGLCTPGTTRVSVATGGAEVVGGMFDNFTPSINDDGRFVVFTSSATDLVPNDTNASIDVFIHDRLASPVATTTRVSLNTTGAQFLGPSGNGTVSADGRFVAFDTGQALVYDTCFGAPSSPSCTPGSFVVSRVPGGANANNTGAGQSAISGDGHFVVFQSGSTNLLPGITTFFAHIYRALTN